MTENEIRDWLSVNLDILEDGLTLLDTEYHLPSVKGTRGFVDILAKDESNRFVVIEVKRSDQAARQALHELLKYAEAIKENNKAKETELRLFVVSTEWKELIVPFSSFSSRINFNSQGFKLVPKGEAFQSDPVDLVKLASDRLMSPFHSINLYQTEAKLRKGIKSHEDTFSKKSLKDYVLLIMDAAEGHHQRSEEIYQLKMREMGLEPPNEGKLPEYPFLIYSAFVRQEQELYHSIVGSSEEIMEWLPEELKEVDRTEDGHLELYEEAIVNSLEPFPEGYAEVSTPAKLKNKLLEDEGWTIREFRRYGALEANPLLENDVLLKEMCGLGGEAGFVFDFSCSLEESSQIEELKRGISRALFHNPVWKGELNFIISEHIKNVTSGLCARINIFNPSNILYAIFRQLTEQGEKTWIPYYAMEVAVEGGEEGVVYVGSLAWNGRLADFNQIFEKYYDGDLLQLVMPLNWGGHESRDLEILADMGLFYCTYRFQVDQKGRTASKLQSFTYQDIPDDTPANHELISFFEKNSDFVNHVIRAFKAGHNQHII